MEFKEFLAVLKVKGKLFWGVWLGFIFLGLAIFLAIPVKNEATLSFDVARENGDSSLAEYQYDQFYRLEADDRFTQSVVQWMGDLNVQRKITDKFKGELLEEESERIINSLRAEKKAVNFLQVHFAIEASKDAVIISKAIKEVLDEKVSSLNKSSGDEKWFKLIASGPTVEQKKVSFLLLMSLFVVLGLFLASFIVVASHYLQDEQDKKQKNEDRN